MYIMSLNYFTNFLAVNNPTQIQLICHLSMRKLQILHSGMSLANEKTLNSS